VGEEFLFDAVPVEPRDRREPPSDRGAGSSAVFEPAGKQLDVCPSHREQLEALAVAPGYELAKILLIG
jgi:hypothetical protein